jgi:hypothetical protein
MNRNEMVLVLLVSLATASVTAGQHPTGVSWRGTTTQERPTIELKVERGAITELGLDWVLPLEEPCPAATQTSSNSGPPPKTLHGKQTNYFRPSSRGNEPSTIDGKTWKANVVSGGPGEVQLAVTGVFLSETEASCRVPRRSVTVG